MSTDKKTIDWYNEHAEDYAKHVRNPNDSKYHAYYEKPAMYKLLPDLKGRTVISLGCGTGEDSRHIKKLGAARSVGIDISQSQIDIAKRSYPECEFSVMDMEHLDFPDQSFDFAYSSLAMSYVKDWTKLLKEVHRVLKPGSSFLFSCEHPIFSAMDLKNTGELKTWTLEIEKSKSSADARLVGDYLNPHPTHGISMDVTTWHRPFSRIFADIETSGLTVKRLVEPLPLEDMQMVSTKTYQSLNVMPEFLIMELVADLRR